MDSAGGASPRQLARLAGALYLINIVGGAFAIQIVPSMSLGPDPAATAHNIQTHELLYRSGLAAHVVVTVTNVGLALIFYELLKVVNRRVALLDVFFILVATAIEAAGLLNQFTPLVLLGSEPYTSALPAAQLQALAYMPWDLSSFHYTIYTVFFGFDIICLAYLVLKSTFLPRAIGVLLAIDGLAYLIYSFAKPSGAGVCSQSGPLDPAARARGGRIALPVAARGRRGRRAMEEGGERGSPDAVHADGGTVMKRCRRVCRSCF